jgi:photosystem II stability/assembly factor-like uncharacterized protein
MKLLGFLVAALCLANSASAQWMQVYPSPQKITSLAAIGPLLFGIGQDDKSNSLFRSDDSGYTWTAVPHNSYPFFSDYLGAFDSTLFGGYNQTGSSSKISYSSDSGKTWQYADSMASYNEIGPFAAHNGVVFAGAVTRSFSDQAFVLRSTDGGHKWTRTTTDATFGDLVTSFAFHNNFVFATTLSGGIWRSSNNGDRWDHLLPTEHNAAAVGVSGNDIFAATSGGFWRSPSDGGTWVMAETGMNNEQFSEVTSILSVGSHLLITLQSPANYVHAAYISANNGDLWAPAEDGLDLTNRPDIRTALVAGDYLVAGTFAQEVWRRPLADFATVSSTGESGEFGQLWPNPARDRIWISRSSTGALAHIAIEDVTERTLRTFDVAQSGQPIELDLNGLPDGVYQCQLTADGRSEVRRFLVLK